MVETRPAGQSSPVEAVAAGEQDEPSRGSGSSVQLEDVVAVARPADGCEEEPGARIDAGRYAGGTGGTQQPGGAADAPGERRGRLRLHARQSGWTLYEGPQTQRGEEGLRVGQGL